MPVPKPKVTLQRLVLHCEDRWHIDELLIVLSIAWPPNYASLSFCSSKSFHSLVSRYVSLLFHSTFFGYLRQLTWVSCKVRETRFVLLFGFQAALLSWYSYVDYMQMYTVHTVHATAHNHYYGTI